MKTKHESMRKAIPAIKGRIPEVTLGVVAIGHNEGEPLVACLDSLESVGDSVVYVDSGSTGRSIEVVRARDAINLQSILPNCWRVDRATQCSVPIPTSV